MEDPNSTIRPPGSFFTPLLISMAGIVATSLAIVTYHLILVKYCLRNHRRLPNNATNQLPNQSPPIGVDEKVLNAIPILSFSTNHSRCFQIEQSECVICLGEFSDGEIVRLLPNCKHAFHVQCIDDWFLGHVNCPVCRSPVVPLPEASGDEREEGLNQSSIGGEDREELGGSSSGVELGSGSGRGLLRHSVSLALPLEKKQTGGLGTGLKRSLSMDQSCYVLVKIQSDSRKEDLNSPSSSSSSSNKRILTESRSCTSRSMRSLDRIMSSRLMRSFSQLRIGHRNIEILPY